MKLSMKRNILLIALLLLSSSTFASTNVPNSITGDTQWNADGNPYILQGKTMVAKGATLRIGPNVKVIFQGASALEVDGTLDVSGSAAAPAVFDMTQGGLQSELFLNGAQADISSAKFLSGVFLVQDSDLHLQWFEITKGSGLYLRGTGTASVKNGKIYGNATGVVLDGKMNATFRFDTITQNTYGLYLKAYSDLQFKNNSVHDNDKDVVNATPALNLGGNYWGTSDEKTASAKMQGQVSLGPMVSLKDLLRVYIQTQLPEITQEMSVALAKKEKKEARELAEKQKAMNEGARTAQAPAASTAPPPAPEVPPAPSTAENTTEAAPQAAPEAAEAPTPETPEASAPAPEEAGVVKTIQVKSLPPAPHQLTPVANLPPDQGNVAEMPASVPSATASTTAPAAGNEAASTAPPASPDLTLPPAGTASEAAPPIPPEVSGSSTTPPIPSTTSPDNSSNASATNPPPAPPAPPEVSGSTSSPQASSTDNGTNTSATNPPPAPPVPPAPDTIAPPDITTGTAPISTTTSPSSTESVPTPPELNEQIPSSSSASPAPSAAPEPVSQPVSTTAVAPPPVPPAPAAANTNPEQSLTPPAMDSPALQLNANPTQNQQNAVNSLNGVSGDIDGMQPPPLDIDVPNSSNSGAGATQSSNGAATQKSNDSGVVLPPIKDSDVAPPKDLDLPPTDDLGNVNLDSKNK